MQLFLSTPSARRATEITGNGQDGTLISIHALREEGDQRHYPQLPPHHHFYPRPPRGGRHPPDGSAAGCSGFLSTPSARRATVDAVTWENFGEISIHALREEGDASGYVVFTGTADFYPRPPRGGRPATGACARLRWNFYPRPPRGGRHKYNAKCTQINLFLSTPSARRATAKTETKSLFSNKLYNILHEFRRALIYNGSKNYPNHAK